MSIYPINDFLTTATAISLGTTALSTFRPAAQASAVALAKTAAPSIKTLADTVKLSQDAQIQLLTQQGQSPAQIASALGLPVATIDSDLYIVPAPTASTTATNPGTTSTTPFSIAA